MKLINTEDAVGHVLCQDLTQIIKGVTKDARFRKGHIVKKEDIPILLSMGKAHLYAWENDESMLHEDEAAMILKDATKNSYMTSTDVKEGKVELIAEIDGVFEIDIERFNEINTLDNIIIATISNHYPVKKGMKIAGMRIIPLIIEKDKMDAVKAIADSEKPILSIRPYTVKSASIIVTGSEISNGIIKDTFSPVVVEKLKEFNVVIDQISYSGDESDVIVKQIHDAKDMGSDLIICTGGMSVDPDDKTPGAIAQSNAKKSIYGVPVLPGAMLNISYLDDIPVLGLPGCVMYAKRTVFDLVLPRIISNTKLSPKDMKSLANGGLCMKCPVCHFPNCSFGKGAI
jgi:molybdopterin biosynthesis enzyme